MADERGVDFRAHRHGVPDTRWRNLADDLDCRQGALVTLNLTGEPSRLELCADNPTTIFGVLAHGVKTDASGLLSQAGPTNGGVILPLPSIPAGHPAYTGDVDSDGSKYSGEVWLASTHNEFKARIRNVSSASAVDANRALVGKRAAIRLVSSVWYIDIGDVGTASDNICEITWIDEMDSTFDTDIAQNANGPMCGFVVITTAQEFAN